MLVTSDSQALRSARWELRNAVFTAQDTLLLGNNQCNSQDDIDSCPAQSRWYFEKMFMLAQQKKNRGEPLIVCETGFGVGRSAATFLTAGANVQYYGFDLGHRNLQHLMSAFLSGRQEAVSTCDQVWSWKTPPPSLRVRSSQPGVQHTCHRRSSANMR